MNISLCACGGRRGKDNERFLQTVRMASTRGNSSDSPIKGKKKIENKYREHLIGNVKLAVGESAVFSALDTSNLASLETAARN